MKSGCIFKDHNRLQLAKILNEIPRSPVDSSSTLAVTLLSGPARVQLDGSDSGGRSGVPMVG